jgi:hypothetical protein
MGKKLVVALVAAIAIAAACATPAFAADSHQSVTGYNNGHHNFTSGTDQSGYAQNAGIYVRTPGSSSETTSFAGPHGGYDTTTNKCQDCHSTHFATGSYMLLRADNRTQACDFCHAGGGGSATNIQMDNQYDATSAIATDTMGFGTGHTLGYKGNAPAGIDPAFSDPNGLACFDCHTPHGNSARVLETFGAPGDIAGQGTVKGDILSASLMDTLLYNMYGVPFTPTVVGNYAGQNISAVPAPTQPNWSAMNAFVGAVQAYNGIHHTGAGSTKAAFDEYMAQMQGGPAASPEALAVAQAGQQFFGSYNVYWGIDADKGNIVTKFWNIGWIDSMLQGFGVPSNPQMPNVPPRVETWKKPLFPKGRFLLLKDPNQSIVNGVEVADTNVAPTGAVAGQGAYLGYKKLATNWNKPLGPAATWGPLSMSKSDDKFPLQFPWAPNGVAMENEMCADCHDGAAGASTQAANVWMPSKTDSTQGSYQVAYSHDSQPKGCARQQIFNPGDDNNMGPHCRNCHTGAASCNQCHGPDVASDSGMSRENWESYWADGDYTAWDGNVVSGVASNSVGVEGKTTYIPPAYVKTNAVANINNQCIDGGFSYPHRTLGQDMLKDSLFGVDFNGQPIAFGQTRGASFADTSAVAAYFGYSANSAGADQYFGRTNMLYPQSGHGFESLVNRPVDNLDSVCIDCHGNATTYEGNAAYVDKWYFPSNFDVSGSTAPNHVTGWELLLKGLP